MLYRARHPERSIPVPTFTRAPSTIFSPPRATCRLSCSLLLLLRFSSLLVTLEKPSLLPRLEEREIAPLLHFPRRPPKSIGSDAIDRGTRAVWQAILTQNQSATPRVWNGGWGGITLSSLNRLFDRYEPIPLFRQYLHPVPANVCTVPYPLSLLSLRFSRDDSGALLTR